MESQTCLEFVCIPLCAIIASFCSDSNFKERSFNRINCFWLPADLGLLLPLGIYWNFCVCWTQRLIHSKLPTKPRWTLVQVSCSLFSQLIPGFHSIYKLSNHCNHPKKQFESYFPDGRTYVLMVHPPMRVPVVSFNSSNSRYVCIFTFRFIR